jgi:transcription termination/antitermination protein NusA
VDTSIGEKWATPTFLFDSNNLSAYPVLFNGEKNGMKNEFVLAFNEVLEDKQLPKDVILEALQAAMVSAYRRAVSASTAQFVEAVVDPETGKVKIFAEKEVVDEVEDDRTEVTIKEAVKVNDSVQVGDMVIVETTPRNFGRVAAQTARQVIQQRIREAERDQQFGYFTNQVGEIISGIIQAISSQAITLGLEMKTEGTMPRNQAIPGERLRVHERIRALLLEVKQSSRGPQIILSRAHRNFLRRLLENEVPEIYHGMVEIRSIAREPGQRSKVAVAALQPGVDPVGACVGLRGVRIQAIVRELNDEKIDVIEWNPDPAAYIAKALSPARVAGVYLNEQSKGAKTATVVVPEDQLSLAIGRDGQNARLAAKLTSWRIDIKSLPEATTDALHKLHTDPNYAILSVHEVDTIPLVEAVLAKKSEGRPVTPEEYSILTQFVDRVERGVILQRQSEKRAEDERQMIASANVPPEAFDIAIEDFNMSDRLYAVISEAGFQTVGDLMLQFRLDSDSILKLNGMGPKGMQELETALAEFEAQYAPPVEEEISSEGELEKAEAAALSEEELVMEQAEIGEAIMSGEAPTEEAGEVLEVVSISEEPEFAVEKDAVGEGTAQAEIEPEAETETGPEAEPQAEAVLAAVGDEEELAEIPVETMEAAEQPTLVTEGTTLTDEEDISSLDELFTLQPEILDIEYEEEDDDEEDGDKKSDRKRKKKSKKRKFVEMEYDPERDVTLVRKKHKRGGAEWEESW